MMKRASIAVLLTCLSTLALAAPGDYEPTYDQSGYGAATLDERVAKLEKKLSGDNQLEMLNRMEQLQGDVLRLRGEVEELTHQLETVKRQQKDMYQDLDRRLQPTTPPPAATMTETPAEGQQVSTATQQTAPPPPAPAPVAPPPAIAPPPAPRTLIPSTPPASQAVGLSKPPSAVASNDSTARQAGYRKGFNLLKEGQYAEAIKEFKSFLAVYPKGEYSDNAVYWLAEAQYVNRDLAAAREGFRRLVREFPQASKISDAQLKLGYIDYDTGQWLTAREALKDVIKRYPDSSAAKLAQKRLDKMKLEGH